MKRKILTLIIAITATIASLAGCTNNITNELPKDKKLEAKLETNDKNKNANKEKIENSNGDIQKEVPKEVPKGEAPKEEAPNNTEKVPEAANPPAEEVIPQAPAYTPDQAAPDGAPQVQPTPPAAEVIPEGTSFVESVEQEIYRIVNEERAKAGVPTLGYNNTMQKYARIKSQDMAERNYFDHKDPDGALITSKMQSDGVGYSAWGENIAYIGGRPSELASQFMTNWMNSTGHRENILSTNFNSIGVGVYKIGDTYYATQEFHR